MTIVEDTRAVTGGVDTRADVHVAAALDPVGGLLGVQLMGAPVRRRPDPRFFRQDRWPAPAQPRRRPPGQQRAVADRDRKDELSPGHPRLR
jgi:hypothetical protein